MQTYYLAVDIGASSGRHIISWQENGQMIMKEVYRFQNLPDESEGHMIWNLSRLMAEVVNGMKACKEAGYIPTTIGIDTWAVDYVLLDEKEKPILPFYCYRDSRGNEGAALVHEIIPFEKLYEHTGIQYQPFNTVYQMYWDKKEGRLDNSNAT